MSEYYRIRKWVSFVTMQMVSVALLTGCATNSGYVDHEFSFDARSDSPGVVILDYAYGNSGVLPTNAEMNINQFGGSPQWNAVRGNIPLGDSLYVKWRLDSTGKEYWDKVDLKPLLPRNMTAMRIYFVVREAQLYVYLTDLKVVRPPLSPIVGPFRTQLYLTKQIYPL